MHLVHFLYHFRDLYSIDTLLRGLTFVVDGQLEKSKCKRIQQAIKTMKGDVGKFVSEKTAAIISDAERVKAMGPYMKNAKELGIQVVPIEFLDRVKGSDPFTLINEMNLSTWQCIDVSCLLSICDKKKVGKCKIKINHFNFSQTVGFHAMVFQWHNRTALTSNPNRKFKNGKVSQCQKLHFQHLNRRNIFSLILDGMAIDADCNLENVHVHRLYHDHFYVATMTLADISQNKNSYHRMQLLESDDKKRYENN